MAKIMIGKYEGTIYSERGGYTRAPRGAALVSRAAQSAHDRAPRRVAL